MKFHQKRNFYYYGLIFASSVGFSLIACGHKTLKPTNINSTPVYCINNNNCVGVGAYSNTTTESSGSAPLIALSANGGLAFTGLIAANAFTLPNDAATGLNEYFLLGSVTCVNQNNCIAVGKYITNNSMSKFPIVALSTDGGNTFIGMDASTSFIPPTDSYMNPNAHFSGIICFDQNNCLAVGNYRNGMGNSVPLVALSTNGGQTFTGINASVSFILPTDALTGSNEQTALSGISCFGKNQCIVVGSYANSEIQNTPQFVPFIAISSNGGKKFIGLNASNSFTPPNDAITGTVTLSGVTCLNKYSCLAVGSYSNAMTTNSGRAALIALSLNGGKTFIGIPESISFTLPNDALTGTNENVTLTGVTCMSQNKCIAFGTYANTSTTNAGSAPLIAVSNNGGQTFTSYNASTSFMLPNDALTGAEESAGFGIFE